MSALNAFRLSLYSVLACAVVMTGTGLYGAWLSFGLAAAGLAAGAVGLWRVTPHAFPRSCLVWQFRTGRVHHWHRPKAGIVACRNSAGIKVWRS